MDLSKTIPKCAAEGRCKVTFVVSALRLKEAVHTAFTYAKHAFYCQEKLKNRIKEKGWTSRSVRAVL